MINPTNHTAHIARLEQKRAMERKRKEMFNTARFLIVLLLIALSLALYGAYKLL